MSSYTLILIVMYKLKNKFHLQVSFLFTVQLFLCEKQISKFLEKQITESNTDAIVCI